MAAAQHKPGAGTSCFCCALLAVGLLCALQEPPPPPTPTRSPRPPRPLRTFDDVKLDLFDEGAEVPQVLEAPTTSQAPAPRMTRRAPGLPNRTKVALLQQARNKQTNGAVTLVVAGQAHLELLMNWLVAYQRHSSNSIIGCLDTTLFDVLRQKNIECVLVPNQGGPLMPGLRLREMARRRGDMRPRASVWESRMRMVLCLLRASYNVTIADTDAVFLSDASSWLSGFDLLASRAAPKSSST